MKKELIAGVIALAAVAGSAGFASAEPYGGPPGGYPPPPPHPGPVDCVCTRVVTFYGPPVGYGTINVRAPGTRVYGTPVVVPGGRIEVQGPPVYVEAPPIRVQAPEIYLHRPEVYVRPSTITVEPPTIHFSGCEPGDRCEPAPHP